MVRLLLLIECLAWAAREMDYTVYINSALGLYSLNLREYSFEQAPGKDQG